MASQPAQSQGIVTKIHNTEAPTCRTGGCINTDIEPLKHHILQTEKAQRMAEFFSLLGDPNRLRLLSLLAKQQLCVCDLAEILEMSESAVSHQLRLLRTMRLVSYQKQGRKVYYSLQDHHVLELYQAVAEHIDEEISNQ